MVVIPHACSLLCDHKPDQLLSLLQSPAEWEILQLNGLTFANAPVECMVGLDATQFRMLLAMHTQQRAGAKYPVHWIQNDGVPAPNHRS
jgi:hypothetical protein